MRRVVRSVPVIASSSSARPPPGDTLVPVHLVRVMSRSAPARSRVPWSKCTVSSSAPPSLQVSAFVTRPDRVAPSRRVSRTRPLSFDASHGVSDDSTSIEYRPDPSWPVVWYSPLAVYAPEYTW